MGQLTDASVVLRLGHLSDSCVRGCQPEEILTKAGVALNQVEANERTPLNAQYAFWVAAQEKSVKTLILVYIWGNICHFTVGQVIEHLFISSENFGEGLKRALAYQRLISDAFDAKLVVRRWSLLIVNQSCEPGRKISLIVIFSECAMSGVLRLLLNLLLKVVFSPFISTLTLVDGAADDEYFRVFECPVSLGQKETRLYFDPKIFRIIHYGRQSLKSFRKLNEQLALEKLQELGAL